MFLAQLRPNIRLPAQRYRPGLAAWRHVSYVGWVVTSWPTGKLSATLHGEVNSISLQWRHNEHDGVSNHQSHHCLLNRLFRRRSKKTPKLRVTGLCAGNSPVASEFPTQMASNAENVSIRRRNHIICIWFCCVLFRCCFIKSCSLIYVTHLTIFYTITSKAPRQVVILPRYRWRNQRIYVQSASTFPQENTTCTLTP